MSAADRKLVLLLADGLRADTARHMMGYLQAHHEAGRAAEAVASAVAEGEVDQGDTVAVAEAESDEV